MVGDCRGWWRAVEDCAARALAPLTLAHAQAKKPARNLRAASSPHATAGPAHVCSGKRRKPPPSLSTFLLYTHIQMGNISHTHANHNIIIMDLPLLFKSL
jgi:hypothetical protein